ncbi:MULTISPECIES: DUF2004 domain-containing protein [Niastella]|uniref:DUF2004 domain-containing protein n=1 Tax=Niastella soli TaxID=2821487 RepID=A0ABS3Z6C5_9BACT|nr:DUF2004 domain-containing protein [Niastella soli]MBO9205240.1 DUF2004 domain-containing protein [Niastella soli]
MNPYMLPHFGEIDPAALEEYYGAVVEFNGREIDLDLNFDNKSIDVARLEKVKQFLDNLASYDLKNKQYIDQDFANEEDCDTIVTYVEHHLGEMEEEELAALIDFGNASVDPERQFINALHLVRVGFYPDSQDTFVVFDYSIGRELTDYLVVINTNENGELDHISMES